MPTRGTLASAAVPRIGTGLPELTDHAGIRTPRAYPDSQTMRVPELTDHRRYPHSQITGGIRTHRSPAVSGLTGPGAPEPISLGYPNSGP